MERRRIAIENIHIGNRHREPDMAKVREIAKSIAEVGLLNPPAVTFRDGVVIDGEETENAPVLIYGRHRLLALESLGEVSVECVVHEVDDLHAELMEIDENLARAELSPAEEAAHIARRKAIWEEIQGETGARNSRISLSDGRASGPQHERKFASEVAAVVGAGRNPESVKRDVQLKLARARELGPDIHRIVGTSLDKGVEMDALIKMPAQEREQVIAKAEAGEQVTARQPDTQSALDAEEQRFWKYWASLSIEAKRRVLPQLKALSA